MEHEYTVYTTILTTHECRIIKQVKYLKHISWIGVFHRYTAVLFTSRFWHHTRPFGEEVKMNSQTVL